uniref:HK97 family phage prohead protease n=1 Tax=Streptomyces sp. NBC_00093 TaxID=2975649 RepID=A0AAU2A084_9ACTN
MKGQRHYLRGYVQRADDDQGDDAAGKPLTIVAATEGRKGDGLNLTMKGAELGRFDANPVVGYGHSYWGRDGLPIGRSDKTWIDGDSLKMAVVFDQDDDFARKVERKYRNKIMNAFSIGFDVWNIGDDGTPEGWELFEVSAVPLPMDPNAIVESGRSGQLGIPDALTAADVAMLRQLTAGRAGAVLSKKNKGLVENAITALQELLDAAGASDDQDDDARAAHEGRLRRLAGIRAS